MLLESYDTNVERSRSKFVKLGIGIQKYRASCADNNLLIDGGL